MNESKQSPANEVEVAMIPDNYIPMSAPIQRLQVPEKPGFVRYWFLSAPGRIQRALQAGYQFVDPSDVKVSNFDLGGDAKNSGNTDLGSRVSIAAGDNVGSDGQLEKLFLMEIPTALYAHGQKYLEEVNESIAASLRGGTIGADETGEGHSDKEKRYSKTGVPDLFIPKTRRR